VFVFQFINSYASLYFLAFIAAYLPTTNVTGNTFTGVTLSAGSIFFGRFTALTLTSGSVIAYKGV
jgi:hypothetical protein